VLVVGILRVRDLVQAVVDGIAFGETAEEPPGHDLTSI
jgi:hypothetical protein